MYLLHLDFLWCRFIGFSSVSVDLCTLIFMWSNCLCFHSTSSWSSRQGCRLMPQEFSCCSNTLSPLYSTIWSSSVHENILFSFWCIACRHTGLSGTNVIPLEWCSSHLGSSFELLAQRLFRTRQKMGTEGENCPALICCKKLGQKIISAPLGKIKSSAGRERARREMVSPGSHFIHRRVWNDFICCVDSH